MSEFDRIYKVGNDRRLVDGDGKDVGPATKENQREIINTTEDILGSILTELKIANRYLENLGTGEITEDDLL